MPLTDTARMGAMLVEGEDVALGDDEDEDHADHADQAVSESEEDDGNDPAADDDDATTDDVCAAPTALSRGVEVDVTEAVLEVQVVSLPYWRRWRW